MKLKVNKYVRYIKYLIILGGGLFQNNTFAQTIEPLRIDGNHSYPSNILFRNTFGTFNKTLLFVRDEKNLYHKEKRSETPIYYVLDTDSNKIYNLFLPDSNYVPLAFLNNDTIVLRSRLDNEWVYMSFSKKIITKGVPKHLRALLKKIPPAIDYDDYYCKFEKSLNKMILFSLNYTSTFEIYSYNFESDIVEKEVLSTDDFCKSCGLVGACWAGADQVMLMFFYNVEDLDSYGFYNLTNKQFKKIDAFGRYSSIDDYYDHKLLVRFFDKRPYQAAIYEMDPQTMRLAQKDQIFVDMPDYIHLYKLGFVAPNKFAIMTGSSADYTTFTPMYNQTYNMPYDIVVKKVK